MKPTWIAIAAIATLLAGCAEPGAPKPGSASVYRLPYADGTKVSIVPTTAEGAIGFAAQGQGPHVVVAARDGVIRALDDNHGGTCCDENCANNFVWVQHEGEEWTKYTHLAKGSITEAGHANGLFVLAGQPLGRESNVGNSCSGQSGQHLSFEVREVFSSGSPLPEPLTGFLPGPLRAAKFCGNQGALVQGQTYTAAACP